MSRLWLALTLFLFLTPAQAQVVTVGPLGSGADFTEIQPAVDAVPAGATVLVAPGTYSSFVLSKDVDVLGPVTGDALVVGVASEVSAIVIRDLLFGQNVLVSGFQAQSGPTCCDPLVIFGVPCHCTPAVLVENCTGTVTLNAIRVDGVDGVRALPMQVTASARVHLMNCTLLGEDQDGGDSVSALKAEESRLIISNSVLIGGSGHFSSLGSTGQTAIVLFDCSLELSNSKVIGGDEGTWELIGAPVPGTLGHSYGSPAIESQLSYLFLRGGPDSLVKAGSGACEGDCQIVSPAVRLTLTSTATVMGDLPVQGGGLPAENSSYHVELLSTLLELPGSAPTLTSLKGSFALGSPLDLQVSGDPGAIVRVFWSGTLGAAFGSPPTLGTVILNLQNYGQFGGVQLDGNGLGSLSVNLPSAPIFVGFSPTFQGLQLAGTASFTNPWTISLQ